MNFLRRVQIPDIILILAIAVLGFLSVHLFDRWSASLRYPFQMDVTEGYILEQATTLARGQSIYRPLDKPPYLVGNYPPLLPLVYAALNGPKAGISSLILGRWLMMASILISALSIAGIALRLTRRILPCLLAPLLFLVSYEVYLWSPFVRVDFPAIALTLAGLFVFVLSPQRRNLIVSGLLFTAAAYTRQTAILAPIACAAALGVHDRRRLGWFIGPAAIVGLVALIVLQTTSHGQFLRHTLTYNANVMDWGVWRALMKNEIWFFHRFLIVAIAATAIAGFVFRRGEKPPTHEYTARTALGIYAILGAISLLSYAKIGAGANYVMEPLASTVIWLAVSLNLLFKTGSPATTARRATAVAISVLILVHSGWLVRRQREMFSSFTPTRLDRPIANGLAQYVRGIEGDVICEEPFYTMLANKPVLFDPFIMTQLSREGKWDQAPFLRMIERRQFARIVTNEDLMRPQPGYERYTVEMAEAVRKHYRRVDTVFGERIPPGLVFLPGINLQYFIFEPTLENR